MILHQSEFNADSMGEVAIEIREIIRNLVEDERALMFSIREIADNAIYHSGTGGGYCLIERSDDHLHVVIRDQGLGIHHHMQEAYGAIDERTAVQWAFQGVSGTADADRGIGLPAVLERTKTGIALLMETGGVAFVGVHGRGHLIGKSTQVMEGVMVTLTLSPQMLRTGAPGRL